MSTTSILTKLASGDRSSEELLTQSSRANPFCTVQYAQAMQSLGRDVWLVGVRSDSSNPDVTLGCIKRGRLSVELEFISLPACAASGEFWRAVDQLCRQAGVSDLVAATFNSPSFELPPLRGELSRRAREEYVLPLTGADLGAKLGSNHKRNVKKAQKAGVNIRRTRDNLDWLTQHTTLMAQSAQRRVARGEAVALDTEAAFYRALMQQGAAELFQAVLGDSILSSVFVMLSPLTGYYQSAGSSPEGMSLGASHFLLHEIAQVLQREGRYTFNLGGADRGSSLARFKLGFGPETVLLTAATAYIGAPWKKKLRSAVTLARTDRKEFLKTLMGSTLGMQVFRGETSSVPPAPDLPVPEARFEPLSEEQLSALSSPADDPDFHNRQMDRLRRFGKSYAYAVWVGDAVAHISWMLPPAAVERDNPVVLQLEEDEREITCCETDTAFRGKGLYPYAIQCLAAVAREQGVRRIYMKTTDANQSSQHGIRKAGLKLIGAAQVIHPPLAPSKTIIRRKFAK